jgi:hypothetical protein
MLKPADDGTLAPSHDGDDVRAVVQAAQASILERFFE